MKLNHAGPEKFEIRSSGLGVEKVIVAKEKLEYVIKLDEKDYPIVGPSLPPGVTESIMSQRN